MCLFFLAASQSDTFLLLFQKAFRRCLPLILPPPSIQMPLLYAVNNLGWKPHTLMNTLINANSHRQNETPVSPFAESGSRLIFSFPSDSYHLSWPISVPTGLATFPFTFPAIHFKILPLTLLITSEKISSFCSK
jgi:hypothetical protein